MFWPAGSEPADEDQVVDDIEDGQVIETGDGNDTVQNTSGAAVSDVNILTFGGNDTVSGKFDDSSISTGDGADVVTGTYSLTDILTGEGDDVIDAAVFNGSIGTGGGDDRIEISLSGDDLDIDAGTGDDFIDVRGAFSVSVDGGEGEDTILVSSSGGGTNYADGGAGNDHIILNHLHVFPGSVSVSGGDGQDTFDATVVLDDQAYNASLPEHDLVTLEDFVPGEDTLNITLQDSEVYSIIDGKGVWLQSEFDDMSIEVDGDDNSIVHLKFRLSADDPAISDTFQTMNILLGKAPGLTPGHINLIT